MRGLWFCAVQFLLLTTWAEAQSVADAVQEFRLLGVWAIDCYQMPTASNEHSTFTKIGDGRIQLVNDFGANYGNMIYRIAAAAQMGGGRLSLRQVLTTDPSIVLDVVLLKVNDKLRTWSSRLSNGTILVSDGIVDRSGGHQTSWEQRCNERWAVNQAITR
jgi:hypothetical protein